MELSPTPHQLSPTPLPSHRLLSHLTFSPPLSLLPHPLPSSASSSSSIRRRRLLCGAGEAYGPTRHSTPPLHGALPAPSSQSPPPRPPPRRRARPRRGPRDLQDPRRVGLPKKKPGVFKPAVAIPPAAPHNLPFLDSLGLRSVVDGLAKTVYSRLFDCFEQLCINYTIIKEGEAEILMHSSNSVFFNKAQVNNRDMSIAVLRTFIDKRKEEHAAMLKKKSKSEQKVLECALGTEAEATSPQSKKANGDCEMHLNQSIDEADETVKELTMASSWKGPRELKAPKVLEALAASGLRALRYAREVDGIGQVIAVDNDKASVEACRRNIQFNGSMACSKLEAHLADARVHMLTHPKEFDVDFLAVNF